MRSLRPRPLSAVLYRETAATSRFQPGFAGSPQFLCKRAPPGRKARVRFGRVLSLFSEHRKPFEHRANATPPDRQSVNRGAREGTPSPDDWIDATSYQPLDELTCERFASRLAYYIDYELGRREKWSVIDRVNADLRCHALCHEVLRLWIDHAVFFRDQEPGGF